MIIAGVDEAGRGALAGPVVAGAVVLPNEFDCPELTDSKQITAQKRNQLYKIIVHRCDYGIGIISAEEIDEIGIKSATEKAMNEAVSKLKTKPDKLLIDGRDRFQFPIESEDIVRGDETEKSISAASVIAKVTRDNLMQDFAAQYPAFGFGSHKGYGSETHRQLLEREIYCEIHRKTYDPLKTILTQAKLF